MRRESRRPFALVFTGGAAGTAARYGADAIIGSWGPWPASTLLVNLLGAFALGWLTGVTADPRWRLLLGTGALGGFTTYSALAVQTGVLLDAAPAVAVAYAVATVLIGVLAAAAGQRWGARR